MVMEENGRTRYIRFFGGVDEATVKNLLGQVQEGLGLGVQRFVILMSSPGGNVYAGLTAYNFLKGIPAEVVTHNFGVTDSVAAVIYCAGVRRLCVPHARFLIHGVQANFPQGAGLEEPQLEERLKSLRMDTENIAGVIAANCGKTEEEVHRAMRQRTTLSPEDAVAWGLIHEINAQLLVPRAELARID